MLELGYKVVYKDFLGQLNSYCYRCDSSVFYKKYHWTFPKNGNGPLAVFKTKEQAKDFLLFYTTSNTYCLYLCEYLSCPNNVFLWAYEGATLETGKNLLKGTVFASGVRLLEEVR
jgi:hypothetical protein